jgi:cytochrome c peroxidase
VTGPYFHDGSMQTLWDVMDHYNKGDGIADPWLDKDMQPLALTEPEIDDRGGVSSLAYKPTI